MLYHYSEKPGIERFVPRQLQRRPGFPAVVWALHESSEFTYWFPRDCPRIVLRRTETLSEENRERFFAHTDAPAIVTIESGWYARLQACTLYRYSLPEELFELFDRTAGYYIAKETVVPAQVTVLTKLVDRLLEHGVELRLTPNLHPLREAILASDFPDFGIYRFREAQPPASGSGSMAPRPASI
ncbi:hypothetical protein J31TS4_23920 [Paenibacillus sp. J31TS4]|uniref:DUF6886 family protein n=1 Tax=Paenibacillus sp. J31TS4 TaxID=2807195 RepID=UPI001B079C20|nr:DUF6886 family protein [Paenibacillus sp. J31TS4]GIP39112.1 hypothetical protein J31TS4_23920 [Paenibacillus sp. J31TS4]